MQSKVIALGKHALVIAKRRMLNRIGHRNRAVPGCIDEQFCADFILMMIGVAKVSNADMNMVAAVTHALYFAQ